MSNQNIKREFKMAKSKPKPKKLLVIAVSVQVWEDLRKICYEQKIPRTSLMRDAIKIIINQYKKNVD